MREGERKSLVQVFEVEVKSHEETKNHWWFLSFLSPTPSFRKTLATNPRPPGSSLSPVR
jgi:hypothetical protein